MGNEGQRTAFPMPYKPMCALTFSSILACKSLLTGIRFLNILGLKGKSTFCLKLGSGTPKMITKMAFYMLAKSKQRLET